MNINLNRVTVDGNVVYEGDDTELAVKLMAAHFHSGFQGKAMQALDAKGGQDVETEATLAFVDETGLLGHTILYCKVGVRYEPPPAAPEGGV